MAPHKTLVAILAILLALSLPLQAQEAVIGQGSQGAQADGLGLRNELNQLEASIVNATARLMLIKQCHMEHKMFRTKNDGVEGCVAILEQGSFDFIDLEDQPPSSMLTSNIVQITGISATVLATVSGQGNPHLRACADSTCTTASAWQTSANIAPGQYVQLSLTSASAGNTTHTADVIIGGMRDAWNVTTRAAPARQWRVEGVGGTNWCSAMPICSDPALNAIDAHAMLNQLTGISCPTPNNTCIRGNCRGASFRCVDPNFGVLARTGTYHSCPAGIPACPGDTAACSPVGSECVISTSGGCSVYRCNVQ